jgi:hypothetical protein
MIFVRAFLDWMPKNAPAFSDLADRCVLCLKTEKPALCRAFDFAKVFQIVTYFQAPFMASLTGLWCGLRNGREGRRDRQADCHRRALCRFARRLGGCLIAFRALLACFSHAVSYAVAADACITANSDSGSIKLISCLLRLILARPVCTENLVRID